MEKLKILKNIWNSKPSYLIMYITSKCNSKCKYCFYWKELNKKKKELTLQEIEKITKNFKNLIYVSLTGGEPFLREDIDKICELFYKNSGTIFMAIPTNGLLPEKIKEKTESILKLCPKLHLSIDISIDAIGKKHDEIRGVKDNFKKAIKTLNYLKELKKLYPNLKIIIHTVFSSYNQNHVKELFEYFKKEKIDQHRIGLVRNDSRIKDATKLSLKKYNEIIGYAEKNKLKSVGIYSKLFKAIHGINTEINLKTLKENRMIIPCVAGKKMLIIGEEGEVYPCEILGKKLGNLRDYSYDVNKLLKNKKTKEVRKFIKKNKCYCTWGCATQNNIIFNIKNYPKIFYKTFL